MLGLIKKETTRKQEDKYELMKSVKLVDVKGYLQKEYQRATERENLIRELETEIDGLKSISIKYDAMLVVQEETQKRIERQDNIIKELKEINANKSDEIRLAVSKQADIKINAEKKLKQKDEEIKELKKQIRVLTKQTQKKGKGE